VAVEAGLQGVVCSPQEVSLLRRRLGPVPQIVVPGIRRRTDPTGDQARVATAKDAVANGATYLVIGRPILQASDPAAVLEQFLEEAR
ncbi:MAG TPA: orotidine 5'-phosphate decarboxylase / HUMPS family protein, partial [Gemmatimonadales bacterium]|nr:orotidine 5'-phosphate decarboxylase / HUMPS family protein [Gemmatimonadales bacterium]